MKFINEVEKPIGITENTAMLEEIGSASVVFIAPGDTVIMATEYWYSPDKRSTMLDLWRDVLPNSNVIFVPPDARIVGVVELTNEPDDGEKEQLRVWWQRTIRYMGGA